MPLQREDFHARWWNGVALWYNEALYSDAMAEWEDALEVIGLPIRNKAKHAELSEKLLQTSQVIITPGSLETSAAPLLLFLAGCFLDAGVVSKAREALFACITCTQVADIRTKAIVELISSYEEDESCPDPWNRCRRLVQCTIDNNLSNRWRHPQQRPGFIYPIADQKAVYVDDERPPWCHKLEDHWKDIRAEFRRLFKFTDHSQVALHWPSVGDSLHREGAGQHDGSVISSGDWKEFVLFGSGGRPELAPHTANLLQQIAPAAVSLALAGGGEIIFSVLAPGTSIKPHCGTHNLRLTAHLGLEVPPDYDACAIRVCDTWCKWEPGKVLCFDDSFEHEVRNLTDQIRAILLLRFWHPSLPENERSFALEKAIRAKEEDRLRRYNPPLPIENKRTMDRGLELSRCNHCMSTGYSTIRLRREDWALQCVCGSSIT